MRDRRIGLRLITDLDVLHRHGFTRGGDEHASRAGFLIGDLTRIWEGSQDQPFGLSINQVLPKAPVRASRDTVIIPASELTTALDTPDIAARHKRDRAETCADRPNQSCPTCQTRSYDVRAHDHTASRLGRAAEAARTATTSQPEPDHGPQPAAGREATQ